MAVRYRCNARGQPDRGAYTRTRPTQSLRKSPASTERRRFICAESCRPIRPGCRREHFCGFRGSGPARNLRRRKIAPTRTYLGSQRRRAQRRAGERGVGAHVMAWMAGRPDFLHQFVRVAPVAASSSPERREGALSERRHRDPAVVAHPFSVWRSSQRGRPPAPRAAAPASRASSSRRPSASCRPG